MVKIRLFCLSGISTSMLVKKMRQEAESKGIKVDIEAFPEDQMLKHLEDGLDAALLGPQVRYILPKAKKICEPKRIPVGVIPIADFGMLNGKKVLDFALQLIGSCKKI